MKKQVLIPYIYTLLQILLIFCMRRFFLLTVYQTVTCYAAVCLIGFVLSYLVQRGKHQRKQTIQSFHDAFLVLWSGFHGVIVLGFMTCGTYYLTLTQVTIVQIVNIFLGFVLYWLFYVLWGRVVPAIGCGNLLIGIVGTLNFYLVRFRGAPFQLSDFKAMQTAGNVANNYDYSPNATLFIALVDLIAWFVVWKVSLKQEQRVKRWNRVSVIGTVILVVGCAALPVMNYPQVHANTNQFAQDAYLVDLLAEIMGSTQTLPEDYSLAEVQEIIEKVRGGEQEDAPTVSPEVLPNILVIMNEAFSDLRVLGEFETNVPVLSYWDSLEKNCIRGWANVSVLGGSTANSEYEFLTSDAVALYPNTIPYNKFFDGTEGYPGIASVLEQLGYETTVFHPYLSSGWNRRQVYREMGFDNIVFSEDLDEELDSLRLYVSDKGNYDYIMQHFEEKQKGKPQFFFNITMQNHGGYTYDGDDFETTVQLTGDMAGEFPQTEQYLSLIKASDGALRELLSYLENYEEPTIVVMFGDHQPRLEDGFYEYVTGKHPNTWSLEQRMQQYKTPFLIWHNYETESQQLGDVSLNYLASVLLENAGLPMSDYQEYVLTQYQELPVINTIGLLDATGNVFAKGSEEYRTRTREYRLLMYNHTVDDKNRVDVFFGSE